MENTPESIRQKIKETIQIAKGDMKMSERVEQLLTNICFEMYCIGFKDANRAIKASADMLCANCEIAISKQEEQKL